MNRWIPAAAAVAGLVAVGALFSAAPAAGARPACKPGHHCPSPSPSPTTASPSPTPTAPSPSPTVSPTPAPTTPAPSPTSTSAACNATNGTCGPYAYPGIPMSNGFNTYVEAQQVGPNSGTADTVHVTSPGNWTDTANDGPSGYTGVQMFDNVQQLTNDWGNGGWGNCGSSCTDTPLSALSSLQVSYAETSPADGVFEFAPDVWDDNYGSDVMFWADTRNRCNEGAFGGTVLGSAVLGGQNWTVHRYGGPGAEIIFVLDGPGGPGTCAQQSSGTIDILAGFQWLVANGYMSSLGTLAQLNTGWEICSTAGGPETFAVSSYSIQAST